MLLSRPFALTSPPLQAESLELTEEEAREKARLLAEAFGSWSRRDYRAFIAALERHGRNEREAVVAEVAETTEKDPREVGRYFDVFWARGEGELTDWKRTEDRIAKAEAKIARRRATEVILSTRVGTSPDAYRALSISYGPNKMAVMKGYTEEEDRFLLCTLARLGYGAWDALRAEVLRSEMFRFDWFLKSRSTLDLQRRCDTLIRLLEKGEKGAAGGGDGEEGAGGGGAAPRKRKPKAAPAAAGGGGEGAGTGGKGAKKAKTDAASSSAAGGDDASVSAAE